MDLKIVNIIEPLCCYVYRLFLKNTPISASVKVEYTI